MRRWLILILALVLTLSVGCGQSSLRPRLADVAAEKPAYTPAQGESLLQSRADYEGFSMELFARIAAEGAQNPVISPASAYFALAMVANGAAGETEAAFDSVLGLSTAKRNGICLVLAQSLEQAKGGMELSLANSAWVNEGLTVQKPFLDTLESAYGADMFQAALTSEAAMRAMNHWVKEETKGMIHQLFAEPLEGDNLVMVLINALYLSAKWQYPLDVATSAGEFHLSAAESVQADFMWGRAQELTYIEKEGAQGVVLPYDDGRLGFLALLPAEGESVRELAQGLRRTPLSAYLAAGEKESVFVILPKFSVEYGLKSFKDALSDMGLSVAFDAATAKFPAMVSDAAGPVYIGDVLQKVRLDVHELGTEAAAATAVIMDAGGAMAQVLSFDRPFLYSIVDLETGLPLFMGIMENPA